MILGVDPGQTTGLAWWDEHSQRLEATAQLLAQPAVETVWAWLEEHANEAVEVACERYLITQRTLKSTRQYHALKVAGAVECKCRQLGVRYFEYPAAQAKKLAHDDRLHRLELWRPGQGHANDASRQVVTHLASTRARVFEQLLLDAAHRHG